MGGSCRQCIRHRKWSLLSCDSEHQVQSLSRIFHLQGWAANILAALVNEFSSSKMGEMGLLLEFHNRAHLAFEVTARMRVLCAERGIQRDWLTHSLTRHFPCLVARNRTKA